MTEPKKTTRRPKLSEMSAAQVAPSSAMPSLVPEASAAAIAAARAELIAQGWRPPLEAGAKLIALSEVELATALHIAHRAGQSCGRQVGAESYRLADEYADKAVADRLANQ